MLIAEGSDWFWWYGDDHSSEHDLEFDDLFRRHVRNVYRALDQPVPEELFVTNITTQPPAIDVEPPTGFIEPTIDGEVTSYFEWMGAGTASRPPRATTMHRSRTANERRRARRVRLHAASGCSSASKGTRAFREHAASRESRCVFGF